MARWALKMRLMKPPRQEKKVPRMIRDGYRHQSLRTVAAASGSLPKIFLRSRWCHGHGKVRTSARICWFVQLQQQTRHLKPPLILFLFMHSGGKGGPRKGGGAEKPRSRIPRAKPRSRIPQAKPRSREAEKPNSPGEAEKPRSRIPRAKPRSQECGHVRACFRTYFAHVQTCHVTAHTSHTSKCYGLDRHTLHTCPNVWCNSCSKCYNVMDCICTHCTHVETWCLSWSKCYNVMDCICTHCTHVETWCLSWSKCYNVMDCICTHCTHVETWCLSWSKCYTEWTASVRTARMSQRTASIVQVWSRAFNVLRNGSRRDTLRTCWNVMSLVFKKWYGMDCIEHTTVTSERVMWRRFKVLQNGLHRYTLHTCRTARMSKRVMPLVFEVLRNGLHRYTLHTCRNVWCNACSKCYGMDCIGTHCTHVETCYVTRVQSATEWIASVHTAHMSTRVMSLVFKVLRNGLHRYTLRTCQHVWCNACSKCYGMDCIGTHCIQVETCDATRGQSATEWIAWV